jgi:hypothetical protein
MPMPFSGPRVASYHRLPKRKLSGAGSALQELSLSPSSEDVAIVLEYPEDDEVHLPTSRGFQHYGDHRNKTDKNGSSPATTSWLWFCGVCQSVDMRELAGFILWEALVVLIIVLAVADWILFFRFVVSPENPSLRVQHGVAWAIATALLVYVRRYMRSLCGTHVRSLADHAEIFVAVSLVMVFSANVAFYLHTPLAEPLRDLGFMLIPPQGDHSKWRPISDLMTALLPVVCMIQSYLMTRENRCRIMTTFFRVTTVCYSLRTLTISLTSLPGPAPHCRPGNPLYSPPTSWLDVITRVGPMYGQFFSCGDLIFSGHMAYTNSAMLLYLRTLDRYFTRGSRLRWLIGTGYMAALAALCIAGRKHYSVDVMLGMVISTLVFFHFEHGWLPACVQEQHPETKAVKESRPHHALGRRGGAARRGDEWLKKIVVVDPAQDEAVVEFMC